MAAGDFNGDGFADLAAGVLEPLAIPGAGAVVVLPGSAGGLTGTGSQLFTQDSPGVPDSVEFDDFFGEALAASGPQGSTAAATSPPSHSRLRRTVLVDRASRHR